MLYQPGNPATLGQSATFGISNFVFPGGGFGGGSNIEGPYIEYDYRAHTTPPGVQPPRGSFIGVLWDSIDTSAFPPTLMNPVGPVGSNSSGIAQPLIITNDSPPIYDGQGNVLRTGGGDRIAITGTDPLIDTIIENAARNVLRYPGNFRPTVAPDYTGDEIDVSSDSDFGYSFVNGRPSYSGDLNNILGSLTIAPVAGHNTVVISDKGNTTLTAPVAVSLSSIAIDEMPGTQTIGEIDGLAPAPIFYENLDPGDPFNPNVPLGTMDVTLIGTDSQPTTWTVSGTLEHSTPTADANYAATGGNTLTLIGGATGLNEFDLLNPTQPNPPIPGEVAAPIATNVLAIYTGDGDFNTVNIASDAPTNTGDMTDISAAIVVNGGTGVSNVVNMVDMTDPNGVKATAVDFTGAGGPSQLQNGVVYTQITGFGPASISLTQAAGGLLSANVFGSSMQPLDFNLQSDTISALAITTGDVDQNHIVLGSTAPLFTGNVDKILSSVTANFGAGILNTFVIADLSGKVPYGVLLENDATGTYNQITGYASPLIQYSAAAGGHLDVLMFAANTVPTTFTVGSTLGTGTTLELDGGTNGNDTFNIQGAAADTVTVNTGNGKSNTVNVSSDAPTNTGDLSGIGATTQLTVNAGSGTDTLAVSDKSGAAGATVTLVSTQIGGLTALPILYTKIPGGGLAVNLYGADAGSTTFNVPNTLISAGNTVLLAGGVAGNNAFNIGSDHAANNGQLNKVGSAITVDGGGGPNNNLEINDHGSSGAFNYIIGANSLTNDVKTTVRPFRGVNYTNVQTMTLDATEQANQFVVNPSPTAVYNINGYGPTGTAAKPILAGKGDILSVDFSGVTGPVLTKNANPPGGNSFDGSWTFTNRAEIDFQNIEQFPVSLVAYSADASVSGKPLVKVYYANSDQLVNPNLPQGFLAYEASYHGGVRIAIGFFDNTGQQEIAVAPGAGHAPIIKVFSFDSIANATSPNIAPLYQFQAYASSVNGGLNIAAGNVFPVAGATSEIDSIVTVPSRGVSEVRVFNNISTHPGTINPPPLVAPIRDFTVWSKSFIGGSSVAVADLNGDGRGDIIVGSGSGMAPMIEAFNVTAAASAYLPFRVITPFTPSFRGGVNVSAISAGSGVASPLIIASQGNSGAPTVSVYNGATGALSTFVVPYTGSGSNAPVRTAAKVIGGHLFIYTAQQLHGQSDMVRKYDPSNGSVVDYIFENDPNFLGLFIA